MKNEMTLKKIITDILIFTILVLFTFYFVFRGNELSVLVENISKVLPQFLLIGFVLAFTVMTCEALNIYRTLKSFGQKVSFIKCMKYSFIGTFFSSITPFSTGGQPMQLYAMYKDKIDVSAGSLSLLIVLASYEFVSVLFALLAFLFNIHVFTSMNILIVIMMIIGIVLNTGVLAVILLGIFSKKISTKLINWVIKVLDVFKIKRIDSVKGKLNKQLEEYQRCTDMINHNKKMVTKTLLTSTVQIFAFHSIPFIIYLALGHNEAGYLLMIALQAVLYISVAGIPLPGAVGASETGFIIIYSLIYSKSEISSAMILSRGVSFYFPLIFTGLILLIIFIKNAVKFTKQK